MRTRPLCESPRCRIDRDTGELEPRPAAPGLRLCWTCRDRAGDQLAELPGLYADLEHTLAVDTGLFEKVAGSSSPGIPLNEATAAARENILGVLASWAGLVVDKRGLATAPRRAVPVLARFLAGHLDWLAAYPAAGDFADELQDLAIAGRRAAYPNPARIIPIGACDEQDCPGQLTAIVRARDALLPSAIVCDQDEEHLWPPERWVTLGRRLRAAGAVA